MIGPRRGNRITAAGRRSLPQKSETDRLLPAKECRSGSINYTRMVPAMRECTHSRASVPNDTPDGGWF